MTTVRVRSVGNLRQEITAGNHILYADEPVEAGGEDAGPDPYSYLLSALGSCTAMTVTMYARRKKWPLEAIEVALTHGRDYITDCEGCEAAPMKVDRITREMTFTGSLSEEQRERLLEIAKKCPVHRTLQGPIVVSDMLV